MLFANKWAPREFMQIKPFSVTGSKRRFRLCHFDTRQMILFKIVYFLVFYFVHPSVGVSENVSGNVQIVQFQIQRVDNTTC